MLALDVRFTQSFLTGLVASVNPCGFVLLPTYLLYFLGINGSAPGHAAGHGPASARRQRRPVRRLHRRVPRHRLHQPGLHDLAQRERQVRRRSSSAWSWSCSASPCSPGTGCRSAPRSSRPAGATAPCARCSSTGSPTPSRRSAAPSRCSRPTVLGTVSTAGLRRRRVRDRPLRRRHGARRHRADRHARRRPDRRAQGAAGGMRYVEPASAVLVLLSGLYLTWYWFNDIRDNDADAAASPNVQVRVQNWIYTHQWQVGWTFGLIVAAAVVFVVRPPQGRRRGTGAGAPAEADVPTGRLVDLSLTRARRPPSRTPSRSRRRGRTCRGSGDLVAKVGKKIFVFFGDRRAADRRGEAARSPPSRRCCPTRSPRWPTASASGAGSPCTSTVPTRPSRASSRTGSRRATGRSRRRS